MQADLSPASIIVAYLLPDALRSLIPKLLEFLDASPRRVVVTISWALPEDFRTDAYLASHLLTTSASPRDPAAASSPTEATKARFSQMGFYVYGRRVSEE